MEISNIINKKNSTKTEIDTLMTDLQNTLTPDEHRALMEMIEDMDNKEFAITRDPQKKKYARLTNQPVKEDKNRTNGKKETSLKQTLTQKWVKNISNVKLTDEEISLLARGANFAIVPDQLPIDDYICTTEDAKK